MRYRELCNTNLPVAMAVLKYDGIWTVEDCNDELGNLFGMSREDILQIRDCRELICHKDFPIVARLVELVSQGKSNLSREIRILHSNGTEYWVSIRLTSFCEEGFDGSIMLFMWDMNSHKSNEIKYRILREKYILMEEVALEIPFEYDVENDMVLYSHKLFKLRGIDNAEDENYPLEIFSKCVHPQDRDKFLFLMKKATISQLSGTIDIRINVAEIRCLPQYMWFRLNYKSILDGDCVIRILGRMYNVDEDKLLQEEVRKDPLTGLLNKVECEKRAREVLEKYSDKNHVMLVIDIDNFKSINDTFGHTFGDTVISDAADIIKQMFRESDVVGRIGGDEFFVLMKNIPVESATRKVEELCARLSREYSGGEVRRRISASIGISIYGQDGAAYEMLFDKADRAMYRAKQSGKDGYAFAKGDDKGPLQRKRKVSEWRGRLAKNDKEFLNYANGLMTHARNIDGSLNMLLKQTANRYKLGYIAIYEEHEDKKHVVLTNYYSDLVSFYTKTVFDKTSPQIDNAESGEIIIDEQNPLKYLKMSGNKRDNRITDEMCENAVSVSGKFEYVGGRTGSVCFLSIEPDRKWTKSELQVFGELTRMIAVFVSLRFRMGESKAEIRRIQKRDQLTGLYTLDAFKKKIVNGRDYRIDDKRYAIVYIDISNFGYINENYGYKVGDNVLKMFANEFMEQDFCEIGCRLYSDFFAFFVKGDSVESLADDLKSFNRRFANMQSYQYPSSSMKIASGVYFMPTYRVDIDIAIECAILAWKHAKIQTKKEIVVFEEYMRRERNAQQQMIGEFYESLTKEDFKLFLQPKFDLETKQVYGAEALARWQKSDGRIVVPSGFIDALEKIGYITELDFYIYEELLKLMNKWKRENRKEITISVNFSGRHFDSDGKDFMARLDALAIKYDVVPQLIEIEVTEGVMVKNKAALTECLESLRSKGYRVAIDDFGTGYSSLSVLMDTPADVIKIDKSFIEKDMTERQIRFLTEIRRIIDIAGKESIFEGVETEEQRRLLIECGYKNGQGYLCNEPLPAEKFEKIYMS